jgi:hypothetical protein
MKLLLAALCDRVLNDPDYGHSLIAVFHAIRIQIVQDAPGLPSNAVLPKEWAIFAKYGLESNEEGKDYSITGEIFWPDGSLFGTLTVAAAQPSKDGMAFILKVNGFPMGQNGTIRVLLTLSSSGKTVFGPTELIAKVNVERNLPVMGAAK